MIFDVNLMFQRKDKMTYVDLEIDFFQRCISQDHVEDLCTRSESLIF
jgi:hypothetical protein